MYKIEEISTLYFILLTWSFTCFLVGAFFIKVLAIEQKNPFHRIFLALFWGYTLLSTTYAIYKTEFNTISLGALVLIIYFIWRQRQHKETLEVKSLFLKSDLSWFGALAAVSLFYFLISIWQIQNFSGDLHFYWGDINFYSAVSDYINYTGKESSHFYNWINATKQTPDYFHFTDLWASGLVSMPTNILHYQSLSLIIYPFLITVFTMGIFAWLSPRKPLNFFDAVVLLLCVVFIAQLKISFFSGFEIKSSNFSIFNVSILKTMILGICVLYTLLNSDNKFRDLKFLPLFLSVFFYSTPMPTIIVGLLGYLMLDWYLQGKPDWHSICISVGVLLFYLLFFMVINQSKETLPSIGVKELILEKYAHAESYKELVIWIFKISLSKIVPLLPYLLLLFFLRKKLVSLVSNSSGLKENLLALFVISFIGLLGASVIGFIVDGGQIFENFVQQLANIFAISSLWFFYKSTEGWKKWAVFSVFLITGLFFNNPFLKDTLKVKADEYKSLAKTLTADNPYPRIGFVTNKEFYKNSDVFSRNAKTVTPLINLRRFMDGFWPVNLSVFDIDYGDFEYYPQAYIINGLVGSPFYQFVVNKGYADEDIESAQLDFIKEHHFQFILVHELHPWASLPPASMKKIMSVDNYHIMETQPE